MKKIVPMLLATLLIIFVGIYAQGSWGSEAVPEGNAELEGSSGTETQDTEYTGEPEDEENNGNEIILDTSDLSYIALNGDSISLTGDGANVDGSKVTIMSAGTYSISGTLNDGQIIVDTDDADMVALIFDGVDITCLTSAPIYVANAEDTVISLAEGTDNYVTDGSSYVLDDPDSDEPNAAIFSKDDLLITGSGSLTVNANYNNGIQGKDDLEIIDATDITVNATNDGIKGKDSLVITGSVITIDAGADGMQSTNDEDAEKGYVSIEDSEIHIECGEDGIQAETELTIIDSMLDITAGGGYSNGVAHAADAMPGNMGWDTEDIDPTQFPQNPRMPGAMSPEDIDPTQVPAWEDAIDDETSESSKGLKAVNMINISGGSIVLDCADDAIHCDGNIMISGGVFYLSSGDDAVHADLNLTVDCEEMDIPVCYEGLEGSSVDINGGTISIIADDDGINAAGDGENYIHVTDGIIFVQGDYDGFDSNGDLIIDGGEIYVSGPDRSIMNICPGEEALDYGAENGSDCVVNGGTVIAVGMYAMTEGFQESSEQASFLYRFDAVTEISAGTEVSISDAEGTVLASYVAQKGFSSVAFSSPLLIVGETYTIAAGTYTDSITLTSIATNSGAVIDNVRIPPR